MAKTWLDDLFGDGGDEPHSPAVGPTAPMPEPGTGTAYGRAALAAEAATLAATPEGNRNSQLNISALKLGSLAAAGHLHVDDIRAALRHAAAVAGLGAVEVEKTLASGLNAGLRQPRAVPDLITKEPTVTEVTADEIGGSSEPYATATASTPDASAELEAHEIAQEYRRLRVREAARSLMESEKAGPVPDFDLDTLGGVLARPAPPAARVEGLIPWEANTLISAQRKTGKTTLVLNLARALLTGADFLGRFSVRPITGNVAMLNYEVSAAQLARWATDARIPAERMILVNLRGRRNPLTVADDRQRLAAQLRALAVETIMVDPFGRAFTGTSQNDAGEVGGFLAELDRFARADVGALDLVLCAHAGWEGERTRGSTALEDWPDSIITLTRDNRDDGDGERYLRAIGRDVEVEEDRLSYDTETRTLTLAGAGSRKTARTERRFAELDSAALKIIEAEPGITGAGIGRALRAADHGLQRGDEYKITRRLIDSGRVRVETGKGTAQRHFAVTYPEVPRDTPAGQVGPTPTPPFRGGVGPGVGQRLTYPGTSPADDGRRNRPQIADEGDPETVAGPRRTTCARCGEPLDNAAKQRRGTCGPCELRNAA